LLPEALPLYINHQWETLEIREMYKSKLKNAGELMEVIDRVTKNPDKEIYLSIQIRNYLM
jgi:hypothetical protein